MAPNARTTRASACDKKLTWGQFYSRSCQMAQALRAAGIGPQDRVAFMDKNSIQHFEVFYGCALLNAVSVDINWRLAPPEVAFIVNDTEAKVLIVGPDFVPVLEAIIDQLEYAKTILVIGDHPPFENYEDFIGRHDAIDPGVEAGPDDVAFQLYSSGTTGRPQGVMLTSNNFFALLPMARDAWMFTADSANLGNAAVPHRWKWLGRGWSICWYVIDHRAGYRSCGPGQIDWGTAHHPRFRGSGITAVHPRGAGYRQGRFFEPQVDRVRSLANIRRSAGWFDQGL